MSNENNNIDEINIKLHNENNVKLCVKCNEVKPLEGGFYKAGNRSYQKHCKTCHNIIRKEYQSKTPYISKGTGFKRLPEELRKKIEYDKYVKINFKNIYQKYKDEYPKLKYQTLLRWNRLGQIPNYTENKQS